MGTEILLTAYAVDRAAVEEAFAAVFAEFDRLEALMTVWRPESDVSRLNAAAGSHPIPVSPETREVLRTAHEVSEWTSGGFDVTFGPLASLWKFDAQDKDGSIPRASTIAATLPLVGYRHLVIDDDKGTAFLEREGMRAHLGGIGKGYAVDRAAAILRGRGVRDFMIQAGGDLYVGGLKEGQPWRLGLRDPRGPLDQLFATIDLSNGTFSTSGDYERFFVKDGIRYHHIIDLKTGQPARLCRSVTLVSDRAVIADALSKGVFVLGPERGMALIERIPDVEGVIVSATNEVLVSSGLKGRITLLTSPTNAP